MKTLKIFVAGSKDLFNERNLFKIVANDLQTEFGVGGRRGVHIEVRTFENFEYFFGEHLKGAQDSYNQYISNEADAVFFVFDDKVGGITREEFNVAYDAFKDDGRPRMCVFSKLHPGQPNKDIAELRQMCSAVGQYYTDYADNTDLRNKIERSIRQLCNAKLSGTLPKPSRRKNRKGSSTQQDVEAKPATQQRSFHKRVEPLIGYLIGALGILSILSLVWMGVEALDEWLIDKESHAVGNYYKVGDYYNENGKEGVVFDVWDDGRHGKIVSLDQNKLQWCSFEQYQKEIVVGVDSKSNGKANTDKVMARGDANQYPAFTWCRNKGNDWYLPAIDELKLLLLNDSVHDAVNITLAQKGGTKLYNKKVWESYWSSTEYDRICAWLVGMDGGYAGNGNKYANLYVRAVSAF